MGGRGTYAQGINKPYGKYKEVDTVDDIKILKGIDGHHKLPEESANSKGYVRVDKNNNFKEMRIYDEKHYVKLEIAYHPEHKLSGHWNLVLHAHDYSNGNFSGRGSARYLTVEEIKKYRKFFKGVNYD